MTSIKPRQVQVYVQVYNNVANREESLQYSQDCQFVVRSQESKTPQIECLSWNPLDTQTHKDNHQNWEHFP